MAYFTESGAPATGANLTSAEIRTEFEGIRTAFNQLPDTHPSSPTTRGFNGGTFVGPTLSAPTISGIASVTGTLNLAVGSSVASASTINLTTATGNGIHITGTTAISAVTLGAGMMRNVIFDGALSLTHHATNNNLPGGATFSTAIGDTATYWSDGTTVYCLHYTKKDGTAISVSAGATATTVSVVTLTTQAAVAGVHYILTNAAATTVTLPATPVTGDTVVITVTNALTTNIVARNGQTIMGLAEDLTIDNQNATVELRFVNSSWRLV